MNLYALDIFSGIGGMALAVKEAGFELVGLCEIQPYCRRVLAYHFDDVPVLEDVRDIGTHERWCPEDLTLLTGGFPLQANYSRGERRENDPRALWDEFVRVTHATRPNWVVAETIPRFSSLGLDDAMWDLERAGYATTALVLPAQAFGCPLRKDRLFLLGAKMDGARSLGGEPGRLERLAGPEGCDPGPGLHRVSEWPPDRVDFLVAGLSSIGDATVPGVARTLLREIHAVETEWQNSSGS